MSQDPKDVGDFVEALLDIIGLDIRPEWREAVVRNLTVNAAAAADVAAFALPDGDLPAPDFDPKG